MGSRYRVKFMSSVLATNQQPVSQFAETLIDLLDRIEYRRIDPSVATDPVYKLRYEAYRREEFIPFNALGVCRDEFDELENAHCFGVFLDGRLVSSLRFHHITAGMRQSPSHSVFADILDPMLDQGLSFIDPGRFTADFEASLSYPALPFITLRIAAMASDHYRADYTLSSVRPEHSAFYRRVFDAKPLAEARYYHGLAFPMVLYAAKVREMRVRCYRRYPFFLSTQAEQRVLFAEAGFGQAVRPTARLAHLQAQREGIPE